MTHLMGDTADISHLAEVGYFDMVWFISPEGPESIQIKLLGRYTGPALSVGDAMCATICDEPLIEYH